MRTRSPNASTTPTTVSATNKGYPLQLLFTSHRTMKITLSTLFLTLGGMMLTATVSSAQSPAPFAKAMELFTDHPAAPSGEPAKDLAKLREITRQGELRAIREKIDAGRPPYTQTHPGNVPNAPFPTRLMPVPTPSPVAPPTGPTLRNDNTSLREKIIWQQNQHLFPHKGHGSR